MTEKRKHLYYLDELSDYKVSSHDPDVRGWQVRDVEDRVIGKVDNLLVNKDRKKVVYLDVEVDESIIEANHDPYSSRSSEIHEFINKDGENHLIIPIGLADLNKNEKYVFTDRIDHRTFAETKRMERGYDVDRDYEVIVLESYNRNTGDRDYSERDAMRDRDRGRDLTDRDRTVGTSAAADNMDRNDRGGYEERRDRNYDDDSFYDRGEFDDSRFRRNS